VTKVFTHMTMSLDGYIAQPDDQVGELFDWYEAGGTSVASANQQVTFDVDGASADVLREWTRAGAIVSGRRLFDIADGWGDSHPTGAPVVVVTHRIPTDREKWPRTTFVSSIGEAIDRAREIADGADVTIASASIAQQALALGLVDEVVVSLVPVLFGSGKRYFGEFSGDHLLLDDPVAVEGVRALHLRYAVRKAQSA
jgi:dihydrofolate reductase